MPATETVGQLVLAGDVELRDQPPVVGGIEAAFPEHIGDVVLVEIRSLGRRSAVNPQRQYVVDVEGAWQDIAARSSDRRTGGRRRSKSRS